MTLRSMLAALRPGPSHRRRRHEARRSGIRPQIETLDDRCLPSGNVVTQWNEELLKSLAVNTAPVPSSRNMALVQVAMFDAVNAIDKSYEPYATNVRAPGSASKVAAVAQAAHDTLSVLYPSRKGMYDTKLTADLAGIPLRAKMQGIAVGKEVAQQILDLRAGDGSAANMSWSPPNNNPGTYQLTPPNNAAAANVNVPFITPFALESNFQFRPGDFPALDTPEYARDLNEVKVVGASDADQPGVDRDGNGLPDRIADQTEITEVWRQPRTNVTVWNHIAQDQTIANHLTVPETARLFALLNMALNDGLQTSNEAKYHYILWRPITAIQRADEDNNPATEAETGWMTEHPNTPAYPSYSSNASTIGMACATVLAEVLGRDDIPFDVNWGQQAATLNVTRHYNGFRDAADEEAESRIFGGIHFRFDCVAGQQIGRDVGSYVVANFLKSAEDDQGEDEQLMAAFAPKTTVHRSLRNNQVQPLLNEAIARWQAVGADTSALGNIDVRVANLGGLTLGQAANAVITLDDNAAGWGWYVDRTAHSDSEFTRRGNQGEKNHMDLLTVLTHEVGHLLGYDHAAGGVMQETLNAGVRRTLGATDSTATDQSGGAPTLITWSPDAIWFDNGLGGKVKKR